jgi:hypothetical protein
LNDELQQTRRISGFSSALSQFIRLSGTLGEVPVTGSAIFNELKVSGE